MRTRPALALLRTPRSRRRRASSSRSMPFVVKKRMLVRTSEGSILMPGIVARPSARARALAWSAARRATLSPRGPRPGAGRAGDGSHLGRVAGGDGRSVAEVVGVLQADEGGAGRRALAATDVRPHLVQIQAAVLVVAGGPQLDAGDAGGAAQLRLQYVRLAADDRLVAALAVGEDGDEVGHRAAGDVEGGLLAQPLRGHGLQALDRRVVAQDVVADLGVEHRLAHGGRGLGHRVAAQVDNPRGAPTRRGRHWMLVPFSVL